jgi:hypothetical protein
VPSAGVAVPKPVGLAPNKPPVAPVPKTKKLDVYTNIPLFFLHYDKNMDTRKTQN